MFFSFLETIDIAQSIDTSNEGKNIVEKSKIYLGDEIMIRLISTFYLSVAFAFM